MVSANEYARIIHRNWPFYIVALLIAFGLKYHYSHADCDDLYWILGPTAGLVEQISGISFNKVQEAGFVNQSLGIVIAPSCAGVNILVIAFCMVVFIGIPLFRGYIRISLWFCAGIMASYLFTIAVNSIRIIISIYTYHAHISYGWLTPERIHRMEGIMIYLISLCLFHRAVVSILSMCAYDIRKAGWDAKIAKHPKTFILNELTQKAFVPFFWYVAVVLVLPLVNGMFQGIAPGYGEHAIMVVSGCFAVFLFFIVIQSVFQRKKKAINNKGGRLCNET